MTHAHLLAADLEVLTNVGRLSSTKGDSATAGRLQGLVPVLINEIERRSDFSTVRLVRAGRRGVDALSTGADSLITLPMDFNLGAGVAVLARTPRTLRALLDGLSPEWTDATEGPGTWSPYTVVGHLIHGERTDWIPRAQIILAQGPDRRFTPYDRFAQFRDSQGKPLSPLLDEFERLRAGNVQTLEGWRLTDAELALTGEHPEFGAVTLRQLLATWVAHDLGHLVQVGRVMARQYRDAIGPWHAYLSVMGR